MGASAPVGMEMAFWTATVENVDAGGRIVVLIGGSTLNVKLIHPAQEYPGMKPQSSRGKIEVGPRWCSRRKAVGMLTRIEECCAGIDVGKRMLAVTVMIGPAQ